MLYYLYESAEMQDLNNSYYETLDENFKKAVELVEKDLSHGELISMLKNGNIAEKQIAALRLDTVNSEKEAEVLINNLTGQDGKIREAVSMRVNDFMSNPSLLPFFENTKSYDIFLDAIIDINANICRNIISAVSHLKNNREFSTYFTHKLTAKTFALLDVIKDFDFQEGKYKVNKEVFKLYWCLETLYVFAETVDFSELKRILLTAKDINEYTIREKIAKILTKNFSDPDLEKARRELQHDPNYYVRRF